MDKVKNKNSVKKITEFYELEWNQSSNSIKSLKRIEADSDAIQSLNLEKKSTLLEIGCGMGGNAVRMAESGARIVLVDLSFSALSNLKLKRILSNRVNYVCADAHRLPFRKNVFDRLAVFSVLMFLDLKIVFKDFSRVMKPGARFAFVEPIRGNPFIFFIRFLRKRYRGMANWYSEKELVRKCVVFYSEMKIDYYYLFPGFVMMKNGILRQIFMRTEKILFNTIPFLRRFAWVICIKGKVND
ncbi:MAG: hypothetical protein COS94_09515 [Candidatus Hydrogenedentes bacterium CG07_land_8_20_14_0_80_42_17]|nr:MAG: hypothetical protein AUJ18_05950 [Candidatus Hydrogenedentes bacterium CG1_02_42_14]PIU46655.1 MAG: hypothetical protein COS94_09515 [Candidatus Hydrogenedentes bacterium CG07_land_8_20_14_0_80_42_17]